jgi:hypothetical protein
VAVVTLGTLTHLIAQRSASDGTCNGAKRPKNGTHSSTCSSTAYGSYSLTRVAIITILNTIFVFSHPSHSLVL